MQKVRTRRNFMEGISLVLQHSEELREIKSKMPQNANYLSPESQNELLHCMATMVQNQIVTNVKRATHGSHYSLHSQWIGQ